MCAATTTSGGSRRIIILGRIFRSLSLFPNTPTAHSPCPKGGGAAAANNFISCPQAAVRHLGAHFILGPCLDLHLNLQQQQQQKSNDNSREKDAMLGSAWLEATLSTWMQNNLHYIPNTNKICWAASMIPSAYFVLHTLQGNTFHK